MDTGPALPRPSKALKPNPFSLLRKASKAPFSEMFGAVMFLRPRPKKYRAHHVAALERFHGFRIRASDVEGAWLFKELKKGNKQHKTTTTAHGKWQSQEHGHVPATTLGPRSGRIVQLKCMDLDPTMRAGPVRRECD